VEGSALAKDDDYAKVLLLRPFTLNLTYTPSPGAQEKHNHYEHVPVESRRGGEEWRVQPWPKVTE
jgi:hypothetical protein